MDPRILEFLRPFLENPKADLGAILLARPMKNEDQLIGNMTPWITEYYQDMVRRVREGEFRGRTDPPRDYLPDPLEYCAGHNRNPTPEIVRVMRVFRWAVGRHLRNGQPVPLLGHRVGGYTVRYCLGVGGMGEVYSARYGANHGQVQALKTIDLRAAELSSARGRDLAARFRQESAIFQQLPPHSGFAAFVDAGYDNRHRVAYIVTEQVEGRTLGELVRWNSSSGALDGSPDGGLPAGESITIFRRLLRCIAALHASSRVHRDLHPSNVMLTRDGRVVVIDFGLARLLEDGQEEVQTRPAGVLWYMPPEALHHMASRASDIYTLGKVLYFLLTYSPGWEVDRPDYDLSPDKAYLWSGVPEELRPVVQKAVAADPKDRYPDAASFLAALDAVAPGDAQPETYIRRLEALRPDGIVEILCRVGEDLGLRESTAADSHRWWRWLALVCGEVATIGSSMVAVALLGGYRAVSVALVLAGLIVAALAIILRKKAVAKSWFATLPGSWAAHLVAGGCLVATGTVMLIAASITPSGPIATGQAERARGKGDVAGDSVVTQGRPIDLDVLVWKAGHLREQGKRLWDPDVLPLRQGDAVRLEAQTRGWDCYLYVIWLQADGKLLPGHPWQDDDWSRRPDREETLRELNVPNDPEEGFKLSGDAPGIEAFIVLARDEPLPRGFDLRPVLAAWQPQPADAANPDLAAWLSNGQLDTSTPRRGSFGDKVKVNNPVGVARSLTLELHRKVGGSTRGVCFTYRGK